MNILSRVSQVVKNSGLSVRAFAINSGIKQQTLSNQLNGSREISLSTVEAILTHYEDISAEWLMRGKGNMYGLDNSKELERIEKLTNVIESMQEIIDTKNERIKELETQLKNKSL